MSIEDRVAAALERFRRSHEGDEDVESLEAFLGRMREEGVAKQRTYDLPQLDTVGRRHEARVIRNNEQSSAVTVDRGSRSLSPKAPQG